MRASGMITPARQQYLRLKAEQPDAIEDELVADLDPHAPTPGRRPGLISESEYRSLLSGRELVVSLVLD